MACGTATAVKAGSSAIRARLNRAKAAQKMMVLKIGFGVGTATVLLLFGTLLLIGVGGGADGKSGDGGNGARMETGGNVVPGTSPSNAVGEPGAGTNDPSETPASGSGLDDDGSHEGNEPDETNPAPGQPPQPGESRRNNDLLAFRHTAANNSTLL